MATAPTTAKKPKGNIFSRILAFFKHVAEWVPEHLGDPAVARSIREDLGLAKGPEISDATQNGFKQFGAGLDPDTAAFSELVQQIQDLLPQIKSLAQSLSNDQVDPVEAEYLLFRLIATDFVRLRSPALYAVVRAFLFLEDDVESLALIDPAVFLGQLYGKDLPSGELLAQRLSAAGAAVLQIIDGVTSEDGEHPGHLDINYGWDASPGTVSPLADLVSMRTTTFSLGPAGDGPRLLASINYVPREHGGPGVMLSFGGAVTLSNEPAPNAEPQPLRYKLDAGFGPVFNCFIGTDDAVMASRAVVGTDNPFLKFSIAAGEVDTPAFRWGEEKRTHLDVYESEFGLNVSKDNVAVVAALRNAELVVNAGDADSFLRTLVGDNVKVRFSVGLLFDKDGFRLDGGTRAAVTVPVGRSVSGLLTVHQLELALGPTPKGGALALDVGGAFTATLGPVAVAVDRLGFSLQIDRRQADPQPGIQLFGLNLDLGFKPPEGLGLSIKGSFIKGGGYLFIDKSGHEYAGALELQIGQLGLKAIGILSTREAGDWSLLLLLYTQFPAVQLGFGFTLNGAGGLLGVQHAVDIPQLIAGMKTKAFDDILFPADPVADAPRIINRLRSLFPVSARTLIFAPMLDIGYGTPRFVFIRIGVLIQLENVFGSGDGDVRFSRAVLIGQLKVALGPTKAEPETTVVQLIIDVLGFWDRDQKRYGVIARLRDSKIAAVAITGSLAVWGEYGANSRFLLAAGGFHPRFKDVPAEIGGVLDRLGAAFEVGRFKLAITAYFAMSPGTLQFGVDILAIAKIGPVAIKGNIGFDALIYREPRTYFLVDFRVSVEVSYKGHSLAAVKCIGTIEGPGLWHVAGRVTFSILFWDIDKSFDETWGTSPALDIVSTDVKSLLAAELARPENWSAQLPAGADAMVTLAPQPGDATLLAHPVGRAVFSQRVVPFGLALQRYGSTKVAGPVKFELTAVKLGGVVVPLASCPPVQEHFARAQFLDMSEADKLAKPSFEAMDAGLEFSSAAFHPSASVLTTTLDYETAYIDFDEQGFNPTRPDKRLRGIGTDHALMGVLAGRGAAARAPQRHDERQAAKTRARVNLNSAPLAAATRDTLVAEPTVKLAANAGRAVMLAEQRIAPAVASKVQLCESFELAS